MCVAKSRWQKTDHLRAIWSTFKPLIFIGLNMEVLPSWEVLTVPPWDGQFLICFYGCPMCLVQLASGPEGHISAKWSHTVVEKEKKKKRWKQPKSLHSPAFKDLEDLSWAKRWRHLHTPALKPGEESPFLLYLWGKPSSLRLSYPSPAHQEEATGGGNSYTLQIFIKYLHY